MKHINHIKVLTGLIIAVWLYPQSFIYSQEIEIPSSMNPVGSGARAIGMGGAFIAVADDATAASWNPAGLIKLKKPEFSIVTSFLHREENIAFGKKTDSHSIYFEEADSSNISETNINYLSATYPFKLFNRNMIVSLSYQHLYDFNRKWKFIKKEEIREYNYSNEEKWNYQQNGRLSAIGFSYCIQIIPQLSFGLTLNILKDGLTTNRWEQRYKITDLDGTPELDKVESFSLSGINANMGILWHISQKMSIGAVIKTPFTAKVEHDYWKDRKIENEIPENKIMDEELDMPMSYGIGYVCKFSDIFYISADIYRTEWDDYIMRDEKGHEIYPTSGRFVDQSPTCQVRVGAEYLFINEVKNYAVPIRGGIFYDPAPAERRPDNFFGFSLGTGFTKNNRFSLDIAYQYRFGNDAGKTSKLDNLGFSQDTDEHTVFLSLIVYP